MCKILCTRNYLIKTVKCKIACLLEQNVSYSEYAATFPAKIWNYSTDLGIYLGNFFAMIAKKVFFLEVIATPSFPEGEKQNQ